MLCRWVACFLLVHALDTPLSVVIDSRLEASGRISFEARRLGENGIQLRSEDGQRMVRLR